MPGVATLDDWKAALAAAHAALCRGDHGAHVTTCETWENALVNEAGAHLRAVELGRPKGPVPEDWVRVVHYVASLPSTSPDGMVQGPAGIRLRPSSLRRAAS